MDRNVEKIKHILQIYYDKGPNATKAAKKIMETDDEH